MANKPVKRSATVFPYRGKWRIQYIDAQGAIRTKTAPTKEQAFKDLAVLEQLIANGQLGPISSKIPTLGDWLHEWYASRQGEIRQSTLLSYEASMRLHVIPALGNLRLDRVTPLRIEAFYRDAMSVKSLSPATIKRINAMLTHAFGLAVRYGVIQHTPMHQVRTAKVTKPKIEVLSLEEVDNLLKASQQQGVRSHLRWLLAIRLGLRQGEALALTWSDIDLAQGLVSISKSVNAIPGQGPIVTEPKSEQSVRILPLDSATLPVAHALFIELDGPSGDSLLFPNSKGGYLDARTDYDRWLSLLAMAGVRKVKLHAARHTAATLLLNSGANVRAIQQILGHSSPSFTISTYTHPSSIQLRGALDGVLRLSTKAPTQG